MNNIFSKIKWQPKAFWVEPNGVRYINPVLAYGSITFLVGVFVGLIFGVSV